MKKIDWGEYKTRILITFITAFLVCGLWDMWRPKTPTPPTQSQVERLMEETKKLRAENQRNIKEFERLYIDKGNDLQRQINQNTANDKKHIEDATKWQLPMVGGSK